MTEQELDETSENETEAETEAETGSTDESADTSLADELFALACEVDENFKKRGTREPVQTYLKRLLETISEAPEEMEWQQRVKDWQSAAVDAYQADQDIEVPDGLTEEVPMATKATKKETASTGRSGRKSANGEVKADKPKREAKARAARPAKEPRGESGLAFIRSLVAKNPNIKAGEIAEKLEAKGLGHIKASTIGATRSGMLTAMEALRNAGVLKG
jgi:hypothetical protein